MRLTAPPSAPRGKKNPKQNMLPCRFFLRDFINNGNVLTSTPLPPLPKSCPGIEGPTTRGQKKYLRYRSLLFFLITPTTLPVLQQAPRQRLPDRDPQLHRRSSWHGLDLPRWLLRLPHSSSLAPFTQHPMAPHSLHASKWRPL